MTRHPRLASWPGLARSISISLRLAILCPILGLAAGGCSGTSNAAPITPSTLVSTCSQICGNVLSECGLGSSLYGSCNNACGALLLVPDLCLTQFAGYLACIVGATSISCQANTITIAPASCTEQEQAYASCNNGQSVVSACIALPQSNTSCQTSAGEGLTSSSGTAEFCVGQPSGCTAATSNPIGIGTYCCE